MTMTLRKTKPDFITLFKSFFIRHVQVLFFSLGQLSKTPIATLMTSASLGIALALPAGLNELVISVQELGGNFEQMNKISLFLKQDIKESQLKKLHKQLLSMPEIATINHISPKQALLEFKNYSGFGDALKSLKTNPLPHVFVIKPSMSISSPIQIENLVKKLSAQKEVDSAQLDLKWLKRLFSIIEIGKTGILLISALLALAVLLIIVNTIRLAVENRRSEIVISKLIGATNSFIRRPFLYLGFWYGLFGSLVAIFFVDISLLIIQQPIDQLSSLYQTELISLSIMSFEHNIQILLLGVFLGLMGAGFAVNSQLKNIEPR